MTNLPHQPNRSRNLQNEPSKSSFGVAPNSQSSTNVKKVVRREWRVLARRFHLVSASGSRGIAMSSVSPGILRRSLARSCHTCLCDFGRIRLSNSNVATAATCCYATSLFYWSNIQRSEICADRATFLCTICLYSTQPRSESPEYLALLFSLFLRRFPRRASPIWRPLVLVMNRYWLIEEW